MKKYFTHNEKVARKRQAFVKWALKNTDMSLEKAKLIATRKFRYTLYGEIKNYLDPRSGYVDEL
jgi:hypothetical protein